VPDDHDYVSPIVLIDHGHLHLEARYNYEDLDTASAFIGYNFSFGQELTLDITPKIGLVAGRTEGIAPGYHATLAWKRLDLYVDGEYLFDTEDQSDNY